MHKPLAIFSLLGLGVLAVASSDFWHDKAYTQWSDEEVTKMLSNSPWAQSSKATSQGGQQGMNRRGGGMGRRGGMGMPGGGYPGGGGGYPGGGGGYPGGGGGGYPGGGGGSYPGGGGGGSMPQITATIRWQSALPVREALLRQSGVTKTDDSQVAASLTAPVTSYVIAVLGLPETMPSRGSGRYGRTTDDSDSRDRDTDRDRDADQLDRLKSTTYLNRKDRASLYPEKVVRDKDGSTILFTFPRTTAISLDDKEVEFVTRYGSMEIKRKFKLKDMVYQGKLEL